MKRFQRYDRASRDISKIKSQLSRFANHVVDFDMGCDSYPYLKDIVYGRSNDQNYDGTHFLGTGASRQLTYKAVKMLLPIISLPDRQPGQFRHNVRAKKDAVNAGNQFRAGNTNKDDGTNYAQGQFKHQSARSSHWRRKPKQSYAEAVYTVPTNNYYEPLNY